MNRFYFVTHHKTPTQDACSTDTGRGESGILQQGLEDEYTEDMKLINKVILMSMYAEE